MRAICSASVEAGPPHSKPSVPNTMADELMPDWMKSNESVDQSRRAFPAASWVEDSSLIYRNYCTLMQQPALSIEVIGFDTAQMGDIWFVQSSRRRLRVALVHWN